MINLNKFTFLGLLLISPFCAKGMSFPQGMSVDQIRNAEKQFALDYHGVLTAQNPIQYYWSWVKGMPAIGFALTQVAFSKTTGIQTAPQQALKEIKTLPKEAQKSGEAIINILNKYGLTGCANLILDIKNSYQPYQPIVSLLQRIKAANPGIQMRPASNMGPLLWQSAQRILGMSNPLNALLSSGQIVDMSKYGNAPEIQTPQHLCSESKPHPEYYRSFERAYNNATPKKVTIFVDDKKSNTQAAALEGQVGIHFDRTQKNAIANLEKQLNELGVKI